MDLPSATLLLQIALCVYVAGVVGSLLSLRHERIANLVGFGCATVAGALGIGAGVLGLTSGPANGREAFELWPSLIPYLELTVKLDALRDAEFKALVMAQAGRDGLIKAVR